MSTRPPTPPSNKAIRRTASRIASTRRSKPSIAQAAKPPAATSFVTPNPSAADVARLADDIRKQIKHTADNLRNAAEGAVRSIADAAKHVMEGERLAREEGLHGGLLRGGQKGTGAGAAGSIGGGR